MERLDVYKIVGEYIDDAISGDKTEDRLDFLQMRDDASSGEFDLVLCWDQDRFGRFDLLDAGYWITPFRQAGVRLETVAQGKIDWEDLIGQLIYSVNQLGKAQFLRDLSRNTVRGLLASAKEGNNGTGGGTPYGYRSVNGVVSVVDSEAKIVRWIFETYLTPHGSLRGIATELNRRRVHPPRGKVWRGSTVRAILTRRKYTGAYVYLQQSSGSYFSAQDGEIVPRRKTDQVQSTDPIVHEDRFEAIIDRGMFGKVQAKLEDRKPRTAPKSYRQYPLSGLCKCGDCGGAMRGLHRANGSIYRCETYHQTGRAHCHCNTIQESPLLRCIVRKIQEQYLSKPALDRLRKALKDEQSRTRPKPPNLSRLRKEIDALDRKIDQGADRVLDAPADIVPTLYRKLEDLKAERDQLKAELESLSTQEGRSAGYSKQIDQAIDILKNLGEALAKARPEETKELMSAIITKIDLHFEPGTGRKMRDFSHGTIYVRPDAGGNWSAVPQVTHMNKKGPLPGRARRGSHCPDLDPIRSAFQLRFPARAKLYPWSQYGLAESLQWASRWPSEGPCRCHTSQCLHHTTQ